MPQVDFESLTAYAKSFSGLTPEREELLSRIGPELSDSLPKITEAFYAKLATIPQASRFLEGRVELLKKTHLNWLNSLFKGPFDVDYAKGMYKVGHVHVKVQLPVEFMAGGVALIADSLIEEVERRYVSDSALRLGALHAINAILGFNLIIMQQSFQNSSLNEELDKFLKITGISRALFNNLAAVFIK